MTWKDDGASGHAIRFAQHGQGPEIVWIHGLGARAQSFEVIAAHPALAGFTHTLVELPGHGGDADPGPPASLDRLADRLAAWLVARGRPAVVGHSLGGVLALLLAERGATRAIVDLDGNLTASDCTWSGRIAGIRLDDFVARDHAVLSAWLAGDARPTIRDYGEAMRAASPAHVHRLACDLVAISNTGTLAARHAALSMPALFVAGVPDGVCADSLAQLARHRARWIDVQPAGHWVHVDQPAAVAAAVAMVMVGA